MGLNPKKIISSVTIDGVEAQIVSDKIPEGYIKPEGEIEIKEQGTFNVARYETAKFSIFEQKFQQLINGTLTEVTEEDLKGATKVNDYAFYNQQILKGVTLPNTVEEIGAYSFDNCTALIEFNIEWDKLTTIGDYAFRNVGLYSALDKPINIFLTNACNVGKDAFRSMPKLEKIKIKYTLVSGAQAQDFVKCTNLKEVEFLNGSNDSCWDMFSGVSKLKKLIFPTNYEGAVYKFGCKVENFICEMITPTWHITPDNFSQHIENAFVPYLAIDSYKSATNWSAGTYNPLVKSESDLATIDTTKYTKACVKGNDKGIEDKNNYAIYNYTNGEWVKEQLQ